MTSSELVAELNLDLENVDLGGAYLGGADPRGTGSGHTELEGADLRGTGSRHTELGGADVEDGMDEEAEVPNYGSCTSLCLTTIRSAAA